MNKINSFTSLQSQNEITHGIGVVLEFDRGFDRITCITGKLNKQGEIATSIKEIPSYSAAEIIYADFMPKNAADLYYLVNNLAKTLDGFEQHITISRLENIIQLSKKLAKEIGDVPIFYHDARHSFAKKHLIPLKFSDQSATLSYKMNENEQVYRLNAHYQIDSRHYITHSDLLNITPFGVIRQAEIFLFPDGQTALNSWQMMLYPSLAFLKKDIQVFENQVLSPLSQRYEIQSKSFDMQKKVQTQELAFRQQVYVSEQHGEVIFRLAAQYPEKLIQLPSQQLRLHFDEKTKKFQQKPRNNAAENAFIREFEQLHPDFQLSDGIYALQPSQLIENFWFIDFAEKLKQHDIELFGTQHLSSFQYNLNKPNLSIRVESGIDWFDVHIDIAYGEQKVSLKDIQKAFLKKQHFIELADGTIGMLPEEWINRFAQYFKAGEIKKDSLRISNFQFAIIDELYDHLEQKPAFLQDLYARKQRLQNLHWQENVIVSDGINATLRPYQQHGLNWLAFLHENRLGGCLADDMGLGKTLQAIAFIQYLKTTFQPNLPNLIIAPTSLIFNWQAEIAKFCPSLKVLTFTGQGREKYLEHFTEYDVILTTYGSLIQDIDILQEQAFYYIVLDESQAIKNPQSQRYKAVRLLKAYNRLILSGTPIENNTFDLYAQFNFLNPGLLGNNAHFKKTFADEIDKNKDTDSANLLAKMVNPFILRRTKQQVATELPEKTEIIMYCEMDSAQRQVYNAVKQEYRDYLFSKINSDGINQSQMYILEGLTKLRQICNSPALIEDADYGNESVKLEMLIDNIKEKTGKHKILVFSSFVKMLALIECRLKQENISYEYLDGQTRNRQQKVDNFQNQADIRVFLISTKAGGTGLNLTEADYVFIVDPWWNPAVENQAIDRCYRIGQTKQVMAYRMICRDTIEEKILALQQKKQGIAESIISIDTEKKSFDLDEVKALFA